MLFFLCQLSPSLSCSQGGFWPIKKEWTFTVQVQQSSVKGDTAAVLLPPSLPLWGAGRAQRKGLHGDPLDKGIAQGGSLHFPVAPMTHWSIQHLSVVASQSPVSFQAVSKVTGLSQPTFPCCLCCSPWTRCLPFAVPSVTPVTPFPAWILSLEKRNEIFFLFLIYV